jgi:hypothetical protein
MDPWIFFYIFNLSKKKRLSVSLNQTMYFGSPCVGSVGFSSHSLPVRAPVPSAVQGTITDGRLGWECSCVCMYMSGDRGFLCLHNTLHKPATP